MAPENKTNDRYMVQMFLNFASGELLPLIREMVNPATDEQFRVHCRELFNVKLSYLDNATFNKDYLVANFYTIADIYVYYLLAWAANNGVDLTAYPQVQAYYDKMNSKNCVKDAMLRMGKNPDKVSDLPEQECVECGCV